MKLVIILLILAAVLQVFAIGRGVYRLHQHHTSDEPRQGEAIESLTSVNNHER